MLRLVILSVLVVGSLAGCCSNEDRNEIQAFWNSVWGAQFAHRRVIVAQIVFQKLFEVDPSAKDLFNRVNVADPESPEFKAHCVRVINGLDVLVNLLSDPATLEQQLDHLNGQHKERAGVKAFHFTEIGKAFAEVLPEAGSCFNPGAWDRCFKRLADGISKDLP